MAIGGSLLGAVTCFAGSAFFFLQLRRLRLLNGPGPLIEPFMMVQYLAIALIGVGVAFIVCGFLIARHFRKRAAG